jgi:hypothetical protein
MAIRAGPFTYAELEAVTLLGRGEIRECIRRGIIGAPAGVGQGHHRDYSRWNLVEGVIAAALLRQVRAGYVEKMMERLRGFLALKHIDVEEYCRSPTELYLTGYSMFRYRKDEAADEIVAGNEISPPAAQTFSFTESHQDLMRRSGAGFAAIVVDLRHAVEISNAKIDALQWDDRRASKANYRDVRHNMGAKGALSGRSC